MKRLVLAWLSMAAIIGAALWLRLEWIEPVRVAHRCLGGAQSLGCDARDLGIRAFNSGTVTWLAAACAVLAAAWKHPLSAWLATCCGGIALVLYSPEAGAAASIIGVLRLVRLSADAWTQPRPQYRQRQQRIAQRP